MMVKSFILLKPAPILDLKPTNEDINDNKLLKIN